MKHTRYEVMFKIVDIDDQTVKQTTQQIIAALNEGMDSYGFPPPSAIKVRRIPDRKVKRGWN